MKKRIACIFTFIPFLASAAFADVPPNAPTSVSSSVYGDAALTVSWTAPVPNGGAVVTGYLAAAVEDGSKFCAAGAAATQCQVSGLAVGGSYTFKVKASNADGAEAISSASKAVTVKGLPGAPASATAIPGNASVMVAFSAPAADGGLAITGYTVNAVEDTSKHCATPNGFTFICTVTGLKNGTTYAFRVTAANSLGNGPPSAASAPVVPAAVPDAPTAPVAGAGDAQASVAFAPPASNGSAITLYTVTASPGGRTVPGATSPILVTGLTNGIAYTFKVAARNAVGVGDSSAASNPVTPNAPPVITYAVPAPYTVGIPILNLPAASTGGPVTSYSVSPALSKGLSFDTVTGTFGGTPSDPKEAIPYTVIATGPGGLDTATVNLTVVPRTVAIDPGAFVFQVSGEEKPYTFRLPAGFTAETQKVTLGIVDVWGRKMWSKSINPAESNVGEVSWDGKSLNGRPASAGMYIARISVTGINGVTTTLVRKSVTLKPR